MCAVRASPVIAARVFEKTPNSLNKHFSAPLTPLRLEEFPNYIMH